MVKLKHRRKHLASPWQSLWAPEYFIKVSGYSQYEDWHRALRLRWMPEQRVSHLESVSKTREKQPPAQILLCTGRRCLALLSSSLWHWEQLQQTSCQLWRNPELKAKNKHSTHLAHTWLQSSLRAMPRVTVPRGTVFSNTPVALSEAPLAGYTDGWLGF